MYDWDWRKCPYLMPELSYNYKEQRVALPHDEPEDCLHYNGCSVCLLDAPVNSCKYVTCYGKKNNVECGTHKVQRLKGQQKGVKQKKIQRRVVEEDATEIYEDTLIEDGDTLIEEEDTLMDDEDALTDSMAS